MKRPLRFLKEVRAELAKVIWPTRRRTARLTVLVVIITIIFGAFIAAVDYGLGKGIQYVLDTSGTQATAAPALDQTSPQTDVTQPQADIPAPVTTP